MSKKDWTKSAFQFDKDEVINGIDMVRNLKLNQNNYNFENKQSS